ncbi:SAM-dependent methyltransferase [Pseudonocardia sichuanensis]
MTEPSSTIDTTTPQSPRVWNYWLGGKDNYEVDRQVGDEVIAMTPQLPKLARESRRFLVRAVEYLTGEVGIRQFLDVGTGLPTADNTHQVAQRVAPESKIVYVDNDPVVLAHARALLVGTPEGVTKYLDEDLYEPQKIVREARKVLDFNEPFPVVINVAG